MSCEDRIVYTAMKHETDRKAAKLAEAAEHLRIQSDIEARLHALRQ